MQVRSYRMLRWFTDAIKNGLIDVSNAHKYATLPAAAEEWMRHYYQIIPTDVRPAYDDVAAFSEFFATYLQNSFELNANPGQIRYSPGAHCFCDICSWMINAPNLRTKKVTSGDKHRAERLKSDALRQIANARIVNLTEHQIECLLADQTISEKAALVAYAQDLILRMKGIATGPAVLALWRSFAWTKQGSPKRNFELRIEDIFEAEDQLVEAVVLRA